MCGHGWRRSPNAPDCQKPPWRRWPFPPLSPPVNSDRYVLHTARLRYDILVLEWAVIGAVAAGCLFVSRPTKP